MAYENTDPTGVPGTDDGDLLEEIRKKWIKAKEGTSQWRVDAREDYEFVAGRQWSDEDKAFLEAQRRPVISFNRCGVFVEAVSGAEVNNRQEVRYYPREMGDVPVNEILTEAAKWARDNCNAEDEESEAFRDAAICGLGLTETRMDYDEHPDGMVVILRRDPLKYWYDPAARRKCLEDRNFDFYGEWVNKEDLPEEWQDKITSSWSDDESNTAPRLADSTFFYKGDDKSEGYDESTDKYFLLHYECRKKETFYRVHDPMQGKNIFLEEAQFKKMKKAIEDSGAKFVKQQKWVYYRAFLCGNEILEHGKSPCQDGFSRQVITARRDRNKNCWYGIVRDMKDPQRWANKWLSQVLHIVNTNSKGGAFIEFGALMEPKKAEEQWGSNDAPLIMMNEGGIGKIKERQLANYPAGLDKLMMFAFESMPFVSGINLEALGLANREQAGVLEQQRKQAAFGILAPLFDALRRYRKSQGEILLYFIQNFISDGRLIRIGGQSIQPKYVPLAGDPRSKEYDIIVDDSPTSPDVKQKTWENIMQILPAMLKVGFPIPPDVLDYMPSNSALAVKWKQYIAQNQQLPPQVQEQFKKLQEALQQAGQENAKLKEENLMLKVDSQVDMMKIQSKAESDQARNVTKLQTSAMDAAVEKMRAEMEAQIAAWKAQADADTKERKAILDMVTKLQVEAIKAKSAERTAAAAGQSEKKDSGNGAARVQLDVHNQDYEKVTGEITRLVDKLSKDKPPRKRKIKTPEGRTYEVTEE